MHGRFSVVCNLPGFENTPLLLFAQFVGGHLWSPERFQETNDTQTLFVYFKIQTFYELHRQVFARKAL